MNAKLEAAGGGPPPQSGPQGSKHQKMVALSNKLTSIYTNPGYMNAMNGAPGPHGSAGG